MNTQRALLALAAATFASVAIAQTQPSNNPSSAMPPASNTAPSSSQPPGNGGPDKSAGAKEQQSQKQPCTGTDHSNVNCKQKQGNPNSGSEPNNSSNPK
jgi:hypothetical protein